MTTLKTLVEGIKLTKNEEVVLNFLNNALCGHFGSGNSDVDCNDIAEELGMKAKSVVGIVGSLVKKNLLTTYDTGTGFEVVGFVKQEEMTYESATDTVVEEEKGVEVPATFGEHNPNFKADFEKSKQDEIDAAFVAKTIEDGQKILSKDTLEATKKAKAGRVKDIITDIATNPVEAVKKVFRKYNSAQDIIDFIKTNGVKNLSHLNDKYYGAYDAMVRNGWKGEVVKANVFTNVNPAKVEKASKPTVEKEPVVSGVKPKKELALELAAKIKAMKEKK